MVKDALHLKYGTFVKVPRAHLSSKAICILSLINVFGFASFLPSGQLRVVFLPNGPPSVKDSRGISSFREKFKCVSIVFIEGSVYRKVSCVEKNNR